MFCPNCGKSDQKSDTYCRQCGEFVLNSSSRFQPLQIFFGGDGNPEKQINISIFIGLATTVASGLLLGFLFGYYDAHFERTGESAPTIIYAVYIFLAVIAFWQLLNFVIGLQMKSKFSRRRSVEGEIEPNIRENILPSAATRELLPEAETKNFVEASVIENTTRNLTAEKRK